MGENMKVLENSASKALEKEEKLVDKILQLQHKYKAAEARSHFPYQNMSILQGIYSKSQIYEYIARAHGMSS